MEKRISSTEYRLGFSLNWSVNQFTTLKYYNHSIKNILFLLYFLEGLEKKCNWKIPASFIKIFNTTEYFNLYFVFLEYPKMGKAKPLNKIYPSTEGEADTLQEKLVLLDKIFLKIAKKNEESTQVVLTRSRKRRLAQLKERILARRDVTLDEIYDHETFFELPETSKLLFIMAMKVLNYKLYLATFNDVFQKIYNKPANINAVNFQTTVIKNSRDLFKNFYAIQQWYRRIGGNLYGFRKNLITTYFALTYDQCIPLFLELIKQASENNPIQQRNIINTSYNLLFAYAWVQRNIEGLRLTFKGTIGTHGRSKAMTFSLGALSQSSLLQPVEYYYIKINTKFGNIGFRLWCTFLPTE